MPPHKAYKLYDIWMSPDTYWEEKLKRMKGVTQEDVNYFLKLVKKRESSWSPTELGNFISAILNYCYPERVIELDVDLVNGWIDVGTRLIEPKIIFVEGDVLGSVGYEMWDGCVVVKGVVAVSVGSKMRGGFIYVDGDVGWRVGEKMSGGTVIIEGEVLGPIGMNMYGGSIVIKGSIHGHVAQLMKGGVVIIDGKVIGDVGERMEGGLVVVNGLVICINGIGEKMKDGVIVINGDVNSVCCLDRLGDGIVVHDGYVYFGGVSE